MDKINEPTGMVEVPQHVIENKPVIDAKTTLINGDYHHPLGVEYAMRLGGRRKPDGAFNVRYWQEVALVSPETAFHGRARILNLSPQTALNLLDWLIQERETLEKLAKEQA